MDAVAEPTSHGQDRAAFREPSDICRELTRLAADYESSGQFLKGALCAIADHFHSSLVIARVSLGAHSVSECYSAGPETVAYEAAVENALLDSHVEFTPVLRRLKVRGASAQIIVLAAPMCDGGGKLIGAMSLIVTTLSPETAPRLLGEFQALVALAGILLHQIQPSLQHVATQTQGQDDVLKRTIVKANDFESLHELGFAIANSVKNKFECSQVALGRVRSNKVRIISISGLDDLYPRSPGTRAISQAMEECLDAGEVVWSHPDAKQEDATSEINALLHHRWRLESGAGAVASIPLSVGSRCVAVLGISRTQARGFSPTELEEIEAVVAPFGAAIDLVAQADRTLLAHTTDTLKVAAKWPFEPGKYRRLAGFMVLLALAAFVCFGSVPYSVTAASRIVPASTRVFAAPVDGTIRSCHVAVGDRVVAGQLLYEFDTTDLTLQRSQLESEIAVAQLKVSQALAVNDVQAASLEAADVRVLQSRLQTVVHDLSRCRVVAPSDGMIAAGDLPARIGEFVPTGETLLEFVPAGDWSVELLIPESTIRSISTGFSGRFVASARPEQPLTCEVDRVHPVAEAHDGQNVFTVDATVNGNPSWMRIGMEGTAQIDCGSKPVWWVTFHRIINYVHQEMWF